MLHTMRNFGAALAIVFMAAGALYADGLAQGLDKQGQPDLKSAGPLAFGSDGVLFVGDPQGAAIFAIDTGDRSETSSRGPLTVEKVDAKIAALLGTTPDKILINDMAVNPASGTAYFSVSRGAVPTRRRLSSASTRRASSPICRWRRSNTPGPNCPMLRAKTPRTAAATASVRSRSPTWRTSTAAC